MAKQKPTSRAASRSAALKKSPSPKAAAKSAARKIITSKAVTSKAVTAKAPPKPAAKRPKQRIAISHHREEDFKADGLRTYAQYRDLGIAAIVYVVAGKAIGIVLGAFEIAVFIASPAIHEVKTWWSLRDRIKRSRRAMATAAAAVTGFRQLPRGAE